VLSMRFLQGVYNIKYPSSLTLNPSPHRARVPDRLQLLPLHPSTAVAAPVLLRVLSGDPVVLD